MIRVTLAKKSIYLNTDQKIEEQHWTDREGRWIKNTHPLSFEINALIQRRVHELTEFELKQKLFGNIITLDLIRKFHEKKGEKNLFLDFADAYIKSTRGKSVNTIKLYNTFLKHLAEFRPGLTFNQLTEDLFHEFARWLHETKNLAGVSVHKYFKPFRLIARQAVKEGYLEKDPFFAVNISESVKMTKSRQRVYLEIEEILLLKNFSLPKDRLDLAAVRKSWLFTFYAGFYYSDLTKLKWSDIKNTEYGYCIIAKRFKNEKSFIAPIHKFKGAIEILEFQRGLDPEYVFPEAISEQKYNEKLKELAKLVGIRKNLMNKTARHSFIQFYESRGLGTQHVAKMVGHSRESTTKEYFELSVHDINAQLSKFDFSSIEL